MRCGNMVKTKDLWLSIFCLILGAGIFIYSANYDQYLYDVVGGGGFPRLLAAIVFICGLMLGADYFSKRKQQGKEQEKEGQKAPGNTRAVLAMFVSVLAYILLLTHVGYVVCTFILTGVLLYIQNVKSIKKILLYSAIIVAMLYLLFRVVLGVRLPTGILI